MEFNSFCFVYVNVEYLRALHEADSEVFYSEETDYSHKPHLGILVEECGYKYVIPLTSAKKKHAKWKDVTDTNYRIYEEIDTRKTKIDRNDIIVDEPNINKLSSYGIPQEEYKFHKKRILSVLEIKKMIPVAEGTYKKIDLNNSVNSKEKKRNSLMLKEYLFCKAHKDDIEKKADRIYKRQKDTGEVKKFYCNFERLEEVSNSINRV